MDYRLALDQGLIVGHDLALLSVALLICLTSTALALWAARNGWLSCRRRGLWLASGAVSLVFGVWTASYTAVRASNPLAAVTFDRPTICGAALLALLMVGVALRLAGRGRWFMLPAALAVGAAVTLLHYLGIAAMMPLYRLHWSLSLVLGSVASALLGAMLSLPMAASRRAPVRLGAPLVLTAGIAGLHTIGMAAAEMDDGAIINSDGIDYAMASGIALVFILLAVTLAYLVRGDRLARRRHRELSRLREMADAAIEGLVVVDGGLVVAANTSFQRLVARSEAQLLGQPLQDFLAQCVERPGEFDQSGGESVLAGPDGEAIPVDVLWRPIAFDGRTCRTVAIRDLRGRRRAEAELRFLAMHDPLTGLHNRSSFRQQVEREIELHRRGGGRFALLYLDLDRFKQINDFNGHHVGDEVLKAVARHLSQNLRSGETLARVGGDEFALLCHEIETPAAAALVAQRVIAVIRGEAAAMPQVPRLDISIGIALFPEDGESAQLLVQHADAALYRAKNEGRGIYRFFDQETSAMLRARHELERDLDTALRDGKLTLVYQPQARIEDGRIVGFEALCRWQHPTRGQVAPDVFIPLAEETGLITRLGAWALHTACAEAASWRCPLSIAVNVSFVQLCQDDFVQTVSQTLAATGLDPRRLELELTETALVRDVDAATRVLSQVRELGVRIAMDDFGTGYSSLLTLRSFPFDKIKIDRSFVTSVDCSRQAAAIVRSIVGLARGLGLPVVAEGVETGSELDFLERELCDQAQGYLIGRPLPIDAFTDLLGTESLKGDGIAA